MRTWKVPGNDLRAFHASEVPIVFGTYNSSALAPSTSAETSLSRYVQAAWLAFARNPSQGLLEFGWPMYSPNTTSLGQLRNAGNATGVIFTQGSLVDATCDAVPQLLAILAQLNSIVSPQQVA
ncbi:hypothetical protein CPB84DRAFT_933067 [Gymnopilus junonius]|uniref:Carboxylesterase type B domain-containing protein n=1 Tax=Gymnopilus junonius TaxID=109634 RepID=A0A9P5TT17_GYMJU|nr:hypothetical protein CPB84DRAFT_933067 [Gymnopilus junonius]